MVLGAVGAVGAVVAVAAGVDVAAAAGVPIVYGTADLALRYRANLKAGQNVLVLGASGGVGTAAVQVPRGGGGKG
jgi:NADPH:quinone reductase-like Zn-dependent oxidoreductase